MVETKFIIEAPVAVVRDILLNFKEYPQWNPFIVKIQGNPEVKEQIHVDIRMAGDTDTNHFDPFVLFRWIGQLCCTCFFSGEHYFQFREIDKNRTQFVHGQVFEGCLKYLFNCLMEAKTIKGFQMMNQALKQRCEARNTK